jgi:hypothetical protein
MGMIVLSVCLLPPHAIAHHSFLFDNGTFIMIVMGKLSSLAVAVIICVIAIVRAIRICGQTSSATTPGHGYARRSEEEN